MRDKSRREAIVVQHPAAIPDARYLQGWAVCAAACPMDCVRANGFTSFMGMMRAGMESVESGCAYGCASVAPVLTAGGVITGKRTADLPPYRPASPPFAGTRLVCSIIHCRISTDGGVAIASAISLTRSSASAGSTIVIRAVAPSGGFGRVMVPSSRLTGSAPIGCHRSAQLARPQVPGRGGTHLGTLVDEDALAAGL